MKILANLSNLHHALEVSVFIGWHNAGIQSSIMMKKILHRVFISGPTLISQFPIYVYEYDTSVIDVIIKV